MILPKYEFLEPLTVHDLFSSLKNYGDKAKIIAGGTDLLVNMKKKAIKPDAVISLAKIPELDKIQFNEGKGLVLGPMVTISQIAESSIIKDKYSILSQAAGKLGSWQIRNRATVGGNICTARPAGDMIGPLIAYGARVKITGSGSEREELLEKIFVGPGKTTISPQEILTEIIVNTPEANTGASYIKYGIRRAMEIAMVSVTAVLSFKKGTCTSASIVLGAVAPTFVRCSRSEEMLTGEKITTAIAEKAGQAAATFCSPISDIRGSADYRRQLVRVLTKRSILEASGLSNL